MKQIKNESMKDGLSFLAIVALILLMSFMSPLIRLLCIVAGPVLWVIILFLRNRYRKVRLRQLNIFFMQGQQAYEEQQYQIAIDNFQLILKSPLLFLDSQTRNMYDKALYALASCQYLLKDYPQAIKSYSQLLRRQPEIPTVYTYRGICYGEQGEHELAICDYHKSIELDSSSPKPFYHLGKSHAIQGNYEAAVESYSGAIILNSRYVHAYDFRGWNYFKLGDTGRALADYQKAIEIIREDHMPIGGSSIANLLRMRGKIFTKCGDYDSAIEEYSQSITYDTENASSYLDRGIIYLYQDESIKALEDFQQSRRITQSSSVYYYEALALNSLERYDESLESLKIAINHESDYAPAYYLKGRIYSAQGSEDKAKEAYSNAFSLESESSIRFNDPNTFYIRAVIQEEASLAIEGLEEVIKFCKDLKYKSLLSLAKSRLDTIKGAEGKQEDS